MTRENLWDFKQLEQNLKSLKLHSRNFHIPHSQRQEALFAISECLIENMDSILEANLQDQNHSKHLRDSIKDRISLNPKRIQAMSEGIKKVANLKDPLKDPLQSYTLPNKLQVEIRKVPLGVVGVIYEARPNVSSDIIALSIKSGNCVVLKGGKEALATNKSIIRVIQETLRSKNLSSIAQSIYFIQKTDRQSTLHLMKKREYIDVLIPRGGFKLIESIVENSKIPVIETGVGNCHIFVDEEVDFIMAKKVILNAKTSRVAVCNSAEKLLIHSKIAPKFLPEIALELHSHNVEIVVDKNAYEILSQRCLDIPLSIISQKDYEAEYLDYKISIFILPSLKEAIDHINTYGSHHSDAILTKIQDNANEFLKAIDSSVVYVNASTRFSDGEELGLGSEIGISTQKLHARGPMGLNALLSYKYCIQGSGQTRDG